MAPINEKNDPFSAAKKGKPKRPKGGKKINKADIGLPSDFRYNVHVYALDTMVHVPVVDSVNYYSSLCRHLAHVGFDPQTGAFDVSIEEHISHTHTHTHTHTHYTHSHTHMYTERQHHTRMEEAAGYSRSHQRPVGRQADSRVYLRLCCEARRHRRGQQTAGTEAEHS